MSTAPETDGRRRAAADRRRAREAEIIAATRAEFDQRGTTDDVLIEHVAAAVGINRAIIYRVFTGKEELFALTLVSYLDELHDSLGGVAAGEPDPRERLAAIVGAFVDYGVGHPAFVDCAQALMRYRGDDLLAAITEGALYRLGRGISQCLAILTAVLDELGVEDAVLHANTLYASGLGVLQLARVGLLVTERAPGVPTVGAVSADQVRAHLVASALALAGAA